MTTVLITGAGGYIGSRLASSLLEQGLGVRGLVREREPWLEVDQVICDLTADDAAAKLASALDGVDTIVHLAGENEVTAARTPAAALASTVIAAERVAEAGASADTRRLVYVSTVHVYGARITPGTILTEDMRAEPRAAYGISRLASEHLLASLARNSYESVVFRLTNSVGAPYDPGVDRWTLVANDLCRQGVLTGRLELRSSGVQWRDFVPLASVCSTLVAACEPGGNVAPGTYNLGSGRATTVLALAGMVQDAFERQTGRRPELRAPAPSGDPPDPYLVSVERAVRSGMNVNGSLEDAVAETVDFCLEHFA